eukprot:3941270-Rhodomonas_salina.1
MDCSPVNTGYFQLKTKPFNLIVSGSKSDEVREFTNHHFSRDSNGKPDLSKPKRFICIMLACPAGKAGKRNRKLTKFFQ